MMERVSIRWESDFVDGRSYILGLLKERALLEVTIEESNPTFFSEPAVIVAGIGAIVASVSAALSYVSSRKSGKVLLKGKNGRSIEIPRDLTKNDVDFYIAKAKELDVDAVTIYDED